MCETLVIACNLFVCRSVWWDVINPLACNGEIWVQNHNTVSAHWHLQAGGYILLNETACSPEVLCDAGSYLQNTQNCWHYSNCPPPKKTSRKTDKGGQDHIPVINKFQNVDTVGENSRFRNRFRIDLTLGILIWKPSV